MQLSLFIDRTETGGQPGLIKVKDWRKEKVVAEMATKRTTKVKIEQ